MLGNDYTEITTTIILITVIFWIILKYLQEPKNLPPGPKGIPFIGYLPFLGEKPHITLTKLSKKYGNIITVYFMHERIVVLSTFKLIKETLLKQGDIYAERSDNFKYTMQFMGDTGMAASTGAPRRALRRFALSTMRNLGVGKESMETKIQDEINCAVESIKRLNGKPSDLHDLLTTSVTNIICAIIFGKRYEYNDKKFQHLLRLSRDVVKALSVNNWHHLLPKFLRDVFKIKNSAYYCMKFYKQILEGVNEYYETHPRLHDHDSFINAWRTEVENPKSTIVQIINDAGNPKFKSKERLAALSTELFSAGSDTTSTTIEWAILYLIKYPKIQEKLHQEIDNVIGKDRTPTMTDQKLMPYMEATLMEIHRFSSIAPLALPHCTSEDTKLNGYFIPKNTTVIPNLWAVHMNPELFPDPECFKPERFLTENNQTKRIEELIPFSIGKRQCPGEALARMELFLYMTSLFQNFMFIKDDGDVDLNCHFGLVLEPMSQKVRAILR